MKSYIPYGYHCLDSSDIDAVVAALKSDFITQGPTVQKFEDAFKKKVGARFAVAVSNGTAALHLASLALGLKENDEIITTPISFVATANAALYCGARPVFVDIEKDTVNIDPSKIERAITRRTKAIYPVHFAGLPADLRAIARIAKKHNLAVVEDAAHSLGAKYLGTPTGNCRFSDMTIFSFHPVKHITTGEGGMIVTNNEPLAKKLRLLRTHGITSDDESMVLKDQAADNENTHSARRNLKSRSPWYYEMQVLGYNYRITDIQCALGLSQLKKLDRFISRRRKIAERYNQAFARSPYLIIPSEPAGCKSAWHLYMLRLRLDRIKKTRRQVFEELRAKGIGVHVHYIPLHLQPYYRERFGYKRGDFPEAEAFYDSALTIPLFPGLRDADCTRVINAVLKTVR
ncbi:MAG: UDP-4-amino-4,6-dideoxy-N-acetyl-beta-L-altrosamine transaminase [Candidatus Omnitrophica bacterium]|nr:UDP-4-amino-4,6-dideoxy-N-acetyl-beta-L-altrosamine transaminase [Candidatus Omnitrophota bacterium]